MICIWDGTIFWGTSCRRYPIPIMLPFVIISTTSCLGSPRGTSVNCCQLFSPATFYIGGCSKFQLPFYLDIHLTKWGRENSLLIRFPRDSPSLLLMPLFPMVGTGRGRLEGVDGDDSSNSSSLVATQLKQKLELPEPQTILTDFIALWIFSFF